MKKTDWDEIDRIAAREAQPFGVPAAIHRQDLIFAYLLKTFGEPAGALHYYFSDGANSAAQFREIVTRLSAVSCPTVLEFASGYGCVSRHLAKRGSLELTASDIHPEANEFIRTALGVPTVQSDEYPGAFQPGRRFDVVFALSFFSHMPRKSWRRWLARLHALLEDDGILIFSTHGADSLAKSFRRARVDTSGYWFEPSSEQHDLNGATYGSTVTLRPFVDAEIALLENVEFVEFSPAGWWGHQDVYVVRRAAGSNYSPVMPPNFGKPDYLLPLTVAAHATRRLARHVRKMRF